jgi:hypothetical protein
MSTAPAAKETLPFTPEQKQLVAGVAGSSMMLTAVLFLLGIIQIVSGPVAVFVFGAGVFGALLTMVLGALTMLLGLVMLACSSDFKYLGEMPKYSGNHLRNVANHLTFFHQVQLGLALLLALVVLVRLAV